MTHQHRGACALCAAVKDALEKRHPLPHNSNLLETDRFVVLPAIGPLVPGHVIAVSKGHYDNLAAMPADAIQEYNQLAMRLREAPLLRGASALETEHGSRSGDKTGACVIHTHVHWIPGMGSQATRLAKLLSRLPLRDLHNKMLLTRSYISLRGSTEDWIICDAQGLPSQTIRRLLCDLLDRDDIDWRQNLRSDWVEETLRAWFNV
jgi:diadenosine tetraphosphate (Ap4A) HIT family hydrolase